MERQPLVSILINNYNYGQFVGDAIRSALNQTYPHVEVIIVDDGSTDNSKEVISNFGDQIKPIFKENGGQASAMNAGFEVSMGEIVCLLDSDDLYLPERINKVVRWFQDFPDSGWVFTESAPIETSILETQDQENIFKEIRNSSCQDHPKEIDFRVSLKNATIPNFTPSTSNLCFSRKVLEKIFPLPEVKGYSGMAITDLYIKLLAVGLASGCVSNENLGIYRFHKNLYRDTNIQKKRRMFAEIYTTTGYWINVRFLEFRKISRKIISKGFATYLSTNHLRGKSLDANLDEMMSDYLVSTSLFEKMQIYLMIFYYWLRLKAKATV